MVTYAQKQFGMAAVVKKKGQDAMATLRVIKFLEECGVNGKIRIVSDKEPSIIAVAQELSKRRSGETLIDTVPRGSKGSIGSVDNFAQRVMGLARTLCAEVEDRWKTSLDINSPITPWASRHAAWLENRFQVRRKTGQTAYAQLRLQ